jgi:hypothetical protein
VDAQLSVRRDAADNIIVEVEFQKDGPAGDIIASRLKPVDVGKDAGETISSCVIEPADVPKVVDAGLKLTKNPADHVLDPARRGSGRAYY